MQLVHRLINGDTERVINQITLSNFPLFSNSPVHGPIFCALLPYGPHLIRTDRMAALVHQHPAAMVMPGPSIEHRIAEHVRRGPPRVHHRRRLAGARATVVRRRCRARMLLLLLLLRLHHRLLDVVDEAPSVLLLLDQLLLDQTGR